MCVKGKDTTMKRLLFIIPLLTLVSCDKPQVFYNVYYTFDRDKFVYNVTIPEYFYQNVKKRDYIVSVNNVYYVQVDQLYCTETCGRLAYNEFYVNGGKQRLVIYTHE